MITINDFDAVTGKFKTGTGDVFRDLYHLKGMNITDQVAIYIDPRFNSIIARNFPSVTILDTPPEKSDIQNLNDLYENSVRPMPYGGGYLTSKSALVISYENLILANTPTGQIPMAFLFNSKSQISADFADKKSIPPHLMEEFLAQIPNSKPINVQYGEAKERFRNHPNVWTPELDDNDMEGQLAFVTALKNLGGVLITPSGHWSHLYLATNAYAAGQLHVLLHNEPFKYWADKKHAELSTHQQSEPQKWEKPLAQAATQINEYIDLKQKRLQPIRFPQNPDPKGNGKKDDTNKTNRSSGHQMG